MAAPVDEQVLHVQLGRQEVDEVDVGLRAVPDNPLRWRSGSGSACWRAGRPAGRLARLPPPRSPSLDDKVKPDLARARPMVFKMAISLRFSFTAITRWGRC